MTEESNVEIVRSPVPAGHIAELAQQTFGDLVKAVVDTDRRIMAIGGGMHSDEEDHLLRDGSRQADLWGINLYPDRYGAAGWIEFDSMINLRPAAGNRSRDVEDPATRAAIEQIVGILVRP